MSRFKPKKKLLLQNARLEARPRCSLGSWTGATWLHLAEVPKLGLQHHLNVEELYLPTASCISPASVPDFQMPLLSCRKNSQAVFPQHGGYQDQNHQQNRWNFHQKIEVSVPALSARSPWQQESELFLVCLILLLSFCFFNSSEMPPKYCYAPESVYR